MVKNWVFLNRDNKVDISKANVIDMTPSDESLQNIGSITNEQAMLDNTRKFKIEHRPKKVKRLGEAGNIFTYGVQDHKIIERTDQYMFVETRDHLRGRDGRFPQIGKPSLGKSFYQIGTLYIDKEINEEKVRFNPSIEIQKEDSMGKPTGEIGFNANYDAVYAKYLEVVHKYEQCIQIGIEQNKAKEIETIAMSKRTLKIAECQTAKYKAVGELKQLLHNCKDVQSAMKDKVIRQLINDVTTYDLIIKYLA